MGIGAVRILKARYAGQLNVLYKKIKAKAQPDASKKGALRKNEIKKIVKERQIV